MPPSPGPPDDAAISGLRLLIVDDQPVALRLMRDMLSSMGVGAVLTAPDGETALKLLGERGSTLDAVLCDWTMPELSGLETLRRLRRTHRRLPFYMVTGNADSSAVRAAKEAGVSGYLKKPYSRDELRRKLGAVARMKAFRTEQAVADRASAD